MLNAVDHVVARDGIDAQARQVSVDRDLALAGAGVAVAVGDGRCHAQAAVAQRGQHVRRHVDGPGQVVLHRCGVAVAANGHGHGIARFGIRHGAAEGLACGHFRRVNDVIARHGVDGDRWQRGVYQQVRGVADAVAHPVGGGRVQGVVGLTQTGQIRRRNRQAPASVCRSRRRVVFAVQGHGHHGAFRQVGAGAAHAQVLTFFHRVQHVIVADGVEGHGRQAGIDGHAMRTGAGVARRVGDGRSHGHSAVAEAGNHARRNAHAPVPRCVQHGGVRLAADGDGHLIARCRAGGGAADNVCLTVFSHVNHIVTRDGVDSDRRNGHIHRQVVVHGRRITRLVADRCGNGDAAVG
ncbi:Uncharacterised protein [Enterobacter cloacae]|nr:Uncharacterised protein [Enterobacter cloacae]